VSHTSAGCSECRTLLGGYVLEALEPDEAETVRHHLATCDACAVEYEQLAVMPSLLDIAGPAETPVEAPPVGLEEAVLDRFAQEQPTAKPQRASTPSRFWHGLGRRLARPIPAALTGALAAAAVTAAIIVLPGSSSNDGQYWATLTGSPVAAGATAKADLTVGASGTRVQLHVKNLRGTPAAVYELWCVRDDGSKVSAGTFRTDASGRADVSLTTAAVPSEYHRLSIERHAGGRVMAGEIEYPHS
jgi:anti-sigma factor RsiW